MADLSDEAILGIIKGKPQASEQPATQADPEPRAQAPAMSDKDILKIIRGDRPAIDPGEVDRFLDESVRGSAQRDMVAASQDPFATSRSASAAAGATAGAFLGAPAGPVGAIAGGGLGAFAGAFFPEAVAEISGLFLEQDIKGLPMDARVNAAMREAALDVTMGGTAAAIERGMPAVRGLMRWATRLTPEAKQFAVKAQEQFGVRLDLVTLTERGQKLQDVLGILPLVSKGFTKAAIRRGEDVGKALTKEMTDLGPTLSFDEIGEAALKGAKATYKEFKGEVDRLYGEARALGFVQDVKVNPASLRATVEDLLAQVRRSTPEGRGDPSGPIMDVLEDLSRVSKNQQSYDQMVDGVLKDLKPKILAASKSGDGLLVSRLVELKEAVKQDIRQNSTGGQEFYAALRKADEFYAQGKAFFNSVTAKKFKQIDPDIFTVGATGRPGTVRIDQLFDTVFRGASPQGMRELHALVGEDTFKQMIASRVDGALQRSFVDDAFDPTRFAKEMGLTARDQGRMMDEALRLAGASPARFRDFIEVAETALNHGAPDVSKFVARRVVLSGSIKGSVLAAAGAQGARGGAGNTAIGVLLGLSSLMSIRRVGFMVTNPKAVLEVKKGLRARGNEVALATGLFRLARERLAFGGFTEEEERWWTMARDEASKVLTGRPAQVPVR